MTAGLLTVEQPCPQCGAPVILEESDRLFSCGHCRVRLYLSGGMAPRYFLPPRGGENLIFVPYWHVRGAYFAVLQGDITTRFFDKTLRAAGPVALPLTLGVRTQAMTLRRAARGMAGRFLEPRSGSAEALGRAESLAQAFGGLRGRIVHTAFVGEARSLVYAPCYEKDGALWDAVLQRRQAPLPEGSEALGAAEDTSSWQTRFMPALCPECGWDLPGDRKSVLLVCPGCNRSWESKEGRWLHVDHGFMEGSGDTHLPWWELRVDCDGLALGSYADLARFANLPAAIRPEWHEMEACFRIPAFAIRPRVLLRLAGQLTARPEEGPGTREAPPGRVHPVTLEGCDALAMVGTILALLAVPKRDIYPLLPKIRPRLRAARIIFLPFEEKAGDLVQRERSISFRKNALRG